MHPGQRALIGLVSGESNSPDVLLVSKSPSWMSLEHRAPCLHFSRPQLPTDAFYGVTAPKPKQAKAGQDDLTVCPQLIQPHNSAISHAVHKNLSIGLG